MPTWSITEVSHETLNKIKSEVKSAEVMYEAGILNKEQSTYTHQTPLDIDETRFSTLSRLLRVTALALRFIARLRKKPTQANTITAQELSQARDMWELHIQRKAFTNIIDDITQKRRNNLVMQLGIKIDPDNLLRCHGRLIHSDICVNAKNPILLPKNSHFTTLVVNEAHATVFHSGISHTLSDVRQRYWIPQGRAAVTRILKECQTCRRWEGGSYKLPPMPPLPLERVTSRIPPFTETG